MLLALDTSSAACTAALFDGSGKCVARRDEMIGRGHAERLVPMIAEMMDGRTASQILVGVGPGSFTGIRVGIAAAHGVAIGWNANLAGMSSLALLAAGAAENEVAVSMLGGHGELFVQEFRDGEPVGGVANLTPAAAAAVIKCPLVIGSGASRLVDARGWGEALESSPSAGNSLKLPEAQRSLPPKPVYARAPDAIVKAAA